MLSKVAERVYWMCRYLERVENTARLVRVYNELLLDLPDDAQLDWSLPLRILGLDADSAESDGSHALKFLLYDPKNVGSLLSSLRSVRENARTTRDVVPSEAWQTVNELYLMAEERLPQASRRSSSKVMAEIINHCHQITGILEVTMSHGQAYQFVRLGQSLERADMTSRMIDVAAASLLERSEELRRYDNTIWRAVLRAQSAYQMYRQYVRRRIEGLDVVRFLLHDPDFPRSMAFCLRVLDESAAALPRGDKARQCAQGLAGQLAAVDPASIDHQGTHHLLDDLQLELANLNNVIFQTWFNPLRQA